MTKIGTHNSGTGERGNGLLSWLVTPFARCQSKSIVEQYEAGCRMYDLRVRKNEKQTWVLAHGLWESKKRLGKVLDYLNKKAESGELVHVGVCYEGETDGEKFGKVVDRWVKRYNSIRWTWAAVKKPEWTTVRSYNGVKFEQGFVNLGEGWRKLIPIPWLWKKIVKKEVKERDGWVLVDFL